MRYFLVGLSLVLLQSTSLCADEWDKWRSDPPSHTRDEETATDTGSVSRDLGNGYSAGGFSTNRVTGGYNEAGGGTAIPDGTIDSKESTDYGIFFERRF